MISRTMVSRNDPSREDDARSRLLGVGLDNDDGHVRVTRGENFHLVGGSHDTHEQMQEQAIKFNEKLDQRGRKLEEISRDEFLDIAHETGMTVAPDDLPDSSEDK